MSVLESFGWSDFQNGGVVGKNKRQKQTQWASKQVIQKPHEPTAMELAYRQAEAQKGKDAFETKKIEVRQSSAPLPPSAIRKTPVVQPQASIEPKASRFAAAPTKKPAPAKLGLKCVPDKTLLLASLDPYQGKIRTGQEMSRKDEVITTWKTQVHNGNDLNDLEESDIVIGFDFGTSSSKVIIRDSVRQTAYAVPFNSPDCHGNSYLIPTRLFINEDGYISLSHGEHCCGSIKSRLMDDPDQKIFSVSNIMQTITVSEVAAGYMALVIRHARDWFLEQTNPIYKKTEIKWHINLGVPSKNYDDSAKRKSFQAIAMASWRISQLSSEVNITEVKKIFHEAREYIDATEINTEEFKSLWLHHDFVNTHPEVIMEIVGYARSPLRANGLYLIVDIGATTLDAAMFRIHTKDGEDSYPLLATCVERLGTMMLHNKRVQAVKISMERALLEINAVDSTSHLPDPCHYAIHAHDKDIPDNDKSFFAECSKMIGKTIKDTKQWRDPNSSTWRTELPVFICGGGGRLTLYRNMIKELGSNLVNSWDGFRGFIIKEIPKPERQQLDAPDLSDKEYDRLAVAYGLSFTSDEIGEVIPESKIDDIPKQAVVENRDDLYVSKDMC